MSNLCHLCYSTGGMADGVMVSWLMKPWVKTDVNMVVACRLSGDNRQDIVRWEVLMVVMLL